MINVNRGGDNYEVHPKNGHTDDDVKKLIDDGDAHWVESTKEIEDDAGEKYADFQKTPAIRP